MIDGGLRKEFHTHLRKGFHWQAIESGLTGGGIPDSNYCIDQKEGWVEYKLTGTLKVPIEADQVGWHLRRNRAGGRTFIAVRQRHAGGPRLGVAIDRLFLFPGSAAKDVLISGLRTRALGVWDGGPAVWNWAKVEWFLRAD